MSISGEAESILTRVFFLCCLRRLRYSLWPLVITLLQVTILPPHAGVGGVAPWTAVGIWVSAVILAQAPANANILYSYPCHCPGESSEEHFRKKICFRVSIYHLSCTFWHGQCLFLEEEEIRTHTLNCQMLIHWLTLKVEYNFKIQISKCIHV